MFTRTLIPALALGVLALGPPAAHAQIVCDARAKIVRQIEQFYGEVRKGTGVAGGQALFELWVSEKTGTWTILATDVTGTACVMAVGEHWQDEPASFAPARRK